MLDGTSYTFGVYENSTQMLEDRMTNVHNSTRTFKTQVPNIQQVAKMLILILYYFSPVNTPPLHYFVYFRPFEPLLL